ncbi:MAG: HlyC/CorC family transporter [Candidatus Liptonbacteria bacterium]|nr:HlyC/CorC family transporter [Candidatus Liptonbacteria bacterium]
MAALVILALGLITIGGTLSLIEAALFSYPISKARVYVAQGKFGVRKALELREKPLKTIATLVVLSSTISTVGSIFMGTLAAELFSDLGIGIFSAILTFFMITLAEILPKNIGERWSPVIFPLAAVPLSWLTILISPLVVILEIISKPFTSGASPFTTSEEEIALLTQAGVKEGVIRAGEAAMIERVFKLNDITAGDMMTPRPFVTFLDGGVTIKDAAEFIKNAKHSRLPVYQGNKDNIVGIVHQRDLLRALASDEFDKKVLSYAKEAFFVPDTRLADDLIHDFQEKRLHLAVVVSEYGNIVGVVGLEDVLEELVGEIIDEKDIVPEIIKRVSKDEIIAHGQTKIASINHFFNTEIKSKKTLHGFLTEKLNHAPELGEAFELNGLKFQVEEVSGHQIQKVRVVKIAH